MQHSEMLRDKEAFIEMVLANPGWRFKRDNTPLSELKNKTMHLARLSIRSESVTGGAVPEDEVQLDFVITNGEKDSYGSIMTEKTMRNYAEDAAAGVGFMRDHGEGIEMQLGRTIAAHFDEEQKRVVATISMLRDSDSTPENMRVNEYIRRIERRFYDSCSVAFRDAEETCNICNKGIFDFYRDDPCPHIPKKIYDGVECTYDVDNARLRHVGLVTAPSNPNAKLLDQRNWSDDMRKVKQEGDVGAKGTDDGKSLLERDGEKYRAGLIDTAITAGIRAEDNFSEDTWRERFKSRDADEIIAQTETWKKLGDARWGEGGRQTESGNPAHKPTTETPIIFPDNLFVY